MPRKPSLPRRLRTTARWPLGIALTSWAYMWRTTPIYRREVDGSWPSDGPPAIDAQVSDEDFQRPEDGAGPLFRRRYCASITGTASTATALMREFKADPNRVAPGGMAHFQKMVGDEGVLRIGDEFLVRMPGPWDGPVRVVDVTATSFRFATLDGHLEAGQIEWRARGEGDALVPRKCSCTCGRACSSASRAGRADDSTAASTSRPAASSSTTRMLDAERPGVVPGLLPALPGKVEP
jgi:hypothetical protein